MRPVHPRPALRPPRGWLLVAAVCLAAGPLAPGRALAQQRSPEGAPTRLEATSSTYLRFFQRALLPGPAGAQVVTDTMAPIYESLVLRGSHVRVPWGGEILVEFSGWGNGLLNNVPGEMRFDGDFSVLNVTQRFGSGYVQVGRQIVARGAARFSRLDGVASGVLLPSGLGADAYAGFTVLPRWSQRPGYYQLGSLTDSLVRSPDALPVPDRAGYWALGARASYQHRELGQVGVSVHEERERSELGRRNAAVDFALLPQGKIGCTGLLLFDIDGRRLADARASADWSLAPMLDVTAEYRRTDPALFLSRQSVLGVFSTATFDEIGVDVRYRPLDAVTVGASGALDFFLGGDRGGRAFLRMQIAPDPGKRLFLQAVAGRVVESLNGYFSIRASARYRLFGPATVVAEHYSYFYDNPIRGFATSTVDAANLEWVFSRQARLLVGGSAMRSPYASLDVQSLLRFVYGLDVSAGGSP